VAAMGLLLAGVSVPSLFFATDAALGVLARPPPCCRRLLSTLSMVFPALSLLLPLARFPAFVWMIVAGFTVPKGRKQNP